MFPYDNYAANADINKYKVFPLGESQAFRNLGYLLKELDTGSEDYRHDRNLALIKH